MLCSILYIFKKFSKFSFKRYDYYTLPLLPFEKPRFYLLMNNIHECVQIAKSQRLLAEQTTTCLPIFLFDAHHTWHECMQSHIECWQNKPQHVLFFSFFHNMHYYMQSQVECSQNKPQRAFSFFFSLIHNIHERMQSKVECWQNKPQHVLLFLSFIHNIYDNMQSQVECWQNKPQRALLFFSLIHNIHECKQSANAAVAAWSKASVNLPTPSFGGRRGFDSQHR